MYILPRSLEDTTFPFAEDGAVVGGLSKDLFTQCRMITEKWQRKFPIVDYFQIKNAPSNVAPNIDVPSGIPADPAVQINEPTMIDDLWGESISDMVTTWEQPHGGTPEALILPATDVDNFFDAISIHAAILMEPTERQLKKIGLDSVKDLAVTLPTYYLDICNVTCNRGDYFIWRGEEYEIHTVHDRGYWKNTNVFLYLVLNCKRKRLGA